MVMERVENDSHPGGEAPPERAWDRGAAIVLLRISGANP